MTKRLFICQVNVVLVSFALWSFCSRFSLWPFWMYALGRWTSTSHIGCKSRQTGGEPVEVTGPMHTESNGLTTTPPRHIPSLLLLLH